MSRPAGLSRALALGLVCLGAATAGCSSAGRFLERLLEERPPMPLDSLPLASDARLDSAGRLAGSFVGEGTSRAVHLLSSDTAFIAALLQRYRPDLAAAPDKWRALSEAGVVPLEGGRRRTVGGPAPKAELAVVGSPLGHTVWTSRRPCCAAAPAGGAGRRPSSSSPIGGSRAILPSAGRSSVPS
jgi:hypothetical protein